MYYYIMDENDNPKEKPPENIQVYRMVKCPLKAVLKNYDKLQPIIEDAVKDINMFVINGYQFIRLYLLDKFKNNLEFPNIDKNFILDVLKTVGSSKDNRGKSNKDDNIKNKSTKDEMKTFYNDVYSKLNNTKLIYSNKTHILEQTAKEMITCLKTNISTHFIKHLFKYINCLFKEPRNILIKQEKNKDKRKEMYKELNEDIRNLKSDLINGKIEKSKEEYHEWITENKKYLFPDKITKSIAYDVKAKPTKYISYSFYINSKIEQLGKRPYQSIPQRNNIVPKNIVLNTSGMTGLICSKYEKLFDYNKSELILNCKKYQKHIWSKILKLEKRSIFNNNKYVFYNQMSTDGFSCSLLFILKEYKDKEYGDVLPKLIEEDNIIPKIESITKEKCDEYLTNKYKLVGLDPGKIRPLSIIDESNNFYKYSASRRRFETYTKRSNEIINNEKIKNNIIEKETKLSLYNSRSLKLDKYKEFIENKNKLNTEVSSFYNKMLFRKLQFRRFVRTKQSEETLLNEIENKFLSKEDKSNNKKLLILHGDYSRTSQMKGCMPSPNIGFKKLLLKRFELLEVNEYNTSKLYNKTFKELTNVSIRRNKHKKHLHEILTQKEEPNKRIFVNRDKNACKNILYLGKYYLTNQSRPNEFIAPLGRIRLVKAKPEEKVKKVVKKVISKKKKEIVV